MSEKTDAAKIIGEAFIMGAEEIERLRVANKKHEAFRAKVREMREAQEKRWRFLDPNDAADGPGYDAANDIASKLEAEVDEMIK